VNAVAAIFLAAVAIREPRSPETPCAARTGFASGTVGEAGGHTRSRDSLYILEVSDRPSVLVLPFSCGAARRVTLHPAGQLQKAGIARAPDGAVCALSLDGRSIECFEEASGRPVRRYPLDSRAQSIWTIGGALAYARFEPQADKPLIWREGERGFAAESAFKSRAPISRLPISAPDAGAAAMLENLVDCGLGTVESVPCWRMATGEIRLVGSGSRDSRPISFPEIPNRARAFPLRDVLRTPTGVLWLLINDSPEKKDDPVGPARRLVRLQKDRLRVASLDAPASMILDGDDDDVLVLFRDGSAGRRGAARP
jgi:hypothetical protein